jgi:hypothetical protein
MIDIFALALSHGLLLLMAWRLTQRSDFDGPPERPGKGHKPRA